MFLCMILHSFFWLAVTLDNRITFQIIEVFSNLSRITFMHCPPEFLFDILSQAVRRECSNKISGRQCVNVVLLRNCFYLHFQANVWRHTDRDYNMSSQTHGLVFLWRPIRVSWLNRKPSTGWHLWTILLDRRLVPMLAECWFYRKSRSGSSTCISLIITFNCNKNLCISIMRLSSCCFKKWITIGITFKIIWLTI